jgi:hypothetical protein
MPDIEERREKARGLMFVGLAVWVAGLLVLFFLPAGFHYGHQQMLAVILAVLGVLGAVLMARGWVTRRGSSE